TLETRFWCVVITPFARPVVPEEKHMKDKRSSASLGLMLTRGLGGQLSASFSAVARPALSQAPSAWMMRIAGSNLTALSAVERSDECAIKYFAPLVSSCAWSSMG